MKNGHIIKINAFGGIFTPIKLKQTAEIAFRAGVKHFNFGPRQEIFFNVSKRYMDVFKSEMNSKQLEFEKDSDEYPNLVSSYLAEGIFSNEKWMSAGIYKDIFDQFDYNPRLKLNICDPFQTIVPFFTGELNFISSPTYQYWYLYLNLKGEKIIRWNQLVYSMDIPKISKKIEELYLDGHISDVADLLAAVNASTQLLSKEIEKELELPRYVFPYYEGMNPYGSKFWLGVFRRDYLFPLAFLHDLCSLCIDTNVGQLCITPWRTLIVKGIEQNERIRWEQLLGKHGINLRHSATELNWVVEDVNSGELELKKHIITQLEEKDIRTFGMVFGIKLPSTHYIPASVIIEEKPIVNKNELKLLGSYNIWYTENFNPNSFNKTLFAKNVKLNDLSSKLLYLCQLYYKNLNEIKPTTIKEAIAPKTEKKKILLHQCKHCFSIYDERYGDEVNGINPGILFKELPTNYLCPLCEAPKSDFVEIREEELSPH
jgi:rubredoxin